MSEAKTDGSQVPIQPIPKTVVEVFQRDECPFNYCDWDERVTPHPCKTANRCRHRPEGS